MSESYSDFDTPLPPQNYSSQHKGNPSTPPFKGEMASQPHPSHPYYKNVDCPHQFVQLQPNQTKDSPLTAEVLNRKKIKYLHDERVDSTMDQTNINIDISQLENERENNTDKQRMEEKDMQEKKKEQKQKEKQKEQIQKQNEEQEKIIKQRYKIYIQKLNKILQLCNDGLINKNNQKVDDNPSQNNQKVDNNPSQNKKVDDNPSQNTQTVDNNPSQNNKKVEDSHINIIQNRNFKFIHSSSAASQLVMLWPLQQIPSNLIRQQSQTQFIYLSNGNKNQNNLMDSIFEKAKKQLQNITKKRIKVCKSFSQILKAEEENKNCKSDQNFVVFTSSNQFRPEQLSLSSSKIYVFKNDKAKIGNSKTSNNIQYVFTEQQMIEKLKQHKKVKELPNFLYVSPEDIGTSNRLVRVFHTMLNHKIDLGIRSQILEQFGELLLLIGSKSSFYFNYEQKVKQFVNDLKNNERIIYWYTLESSAYKVLNNLLRSTRHPAQIYYLQPFFKSLYLQIQKIFEEKVRKQGKKSFTCYRGTWLTQAEIEKLKKSKGEVIMNLGFMSTTLRTLAEKFGSSFGNCDLQIQVDEESVDQKFCHGYANIEKHSKQQSQREVLFNPLNNFLVVGFYEDKTTKRLIFKLRYGVLSQLQTTYEKYLYHTEYGKLWMVKGLNTKEITSKAKIMRDIAKSQRQQANKLQSQGQTLIQGNVNLEGSEIYWRKYAEILQSFYDKSKEYSNGQLQEYAKQMNKCIQWKKILIGNKQEYEKYVRISVEHRKMLKQLNMDYAGVLMNLGNIYQTIGEYESAIKVYEQAKQIRRVKLGTNHNGYASVLVNLGLVYQRKGEYESAIKVYEQAKQIRRVKLGTNHNDYAGVLVNLGIVYSIKGEYESAIKVYEQAKQIRRVKLGTNHNDYALVLVNLGNVYEIKGEYGKALSFYQSSQQIFSLSLGQVSFQYIKQFSTFPFSFSSLISLINAQQSSCIAELN